MAPRKPVRARMVTQTAAEKAARAALLQSAQLGLTAMAGRVSTATRGAFSGSRTLRHAGDSLSRYNMGNYSDTLGGFYPTPPTGPPGGSSAAPPPRPRPKPKPKPKPSGGTGGTSGSTGTAARDENRREQERQRIKALKKSEAAQAKREHTSTRNGKINVF